MNFQHFVSGSFGWVHFVASMLALVFGTLVLARQKGTRSHTRIGYAYTFSMVVLNASAFLIYRLFGKFGPFHVLAVVSSLTLAAGLVPILIRKNERSISLHLGFMYWSVIGLYAAFVAEMIVRIPCFRWFYGNIGASTGIATAVVMLAGGIVFGLKSRRWSDQFAKNRD